MPDNLFVIQNVTIRGYFQKGYLPRISIKKSILHFSPFQIVYSAVEFSDIAYRLRD